MIETSYEVWVDGQLGLTYYHQADAITCAFSLVLNNPSLVVRIIKIVRTTINVNA